MDKTRKEFHEKSSHSSRAEQQVTSAAYQPGDERQTPVVPAGPGVGSARLFEKDASGHAIHTIRGLKPRHLQMIAVGGTIGTGLFVGTGGALAKAGPLGLFLAFVIYASMVWCVCQCTGEVTTMFPLEGGFAHHSGRFVDPAVGFAQSWNYFYVSAQSDPTLL